MNTCAVDDCLKPAKAPRGWCWGHYQRNLKYGSPLKGVRADTPAKRFWAKVDKTPTCWLWIGSITNSGYGRFSASYKNAGYDLAHRVSFEMHHRRLRPREIVMHICDVKLCVRPEHLVAGSHADNTQDAIQKGRFPRGEDTSRAKLTNQQVRDIRSEYAPRKNSLAMLGRKYGVSFQLISQIIHRKNWAWLD